MALGTYTQGRCEKSRTAVRRFRPSGLGRSGYRPRLHLAGYAGTLVPSYGGGQGPDHRRWCIEALAVGASVRTHPDPTGTLSTGGRQRARRSLATTPDRMSAPRAQAGCPASGPGARPAVRSHRSAIPRAPSEAGNLPRPAHTSAGRRRAVTQTRRCGAWRSVTDRGSGPRTLVPADPDHRHICPIGAEDRKSHPCPAESVPACPRPSVVDVRPLARAARGIARTGKPCWSSRSSHRS
jgi:hypothetical protein